MIEGGASEPWHGPRPLPSSPEYRSSSGSPTGLSNALSSVFWHVTNQAAGQQKQGIFGFNCRQIAGSAKWSTHAWGIAVDTNTVPNHSWERHCHIHDLGAQLRNAYTSHGSSEIACDAGHFQYATGY